MERANQARERTPIGWAALAAAAISAIGIAIILVGLLFDMQGAREGDEDVLVFNMAWLSFLFGAIAAGILGAVALALGRRRSEPGTRRAGLTALAWFVVALAIFLVAAVLTS